MVLNLTPTMDVGSTVLIIERSSKYRHLLKLLLMQGQGCGNVLVQLLVRTVMMIDCRGASPDLDSGHVLRVCCCYSTQSFS